MVAIENVKIIRTYTIRTVKTLLTQSNINDTEFTSLLLRPFSQHNCIMQSYSKNSK